MKAREEIVRDKETSDERLVRQRKTPLGIEPRLAAGQSLFFMSIETEKEKEEERVMKKRENSEGRVETQT